MLCRIRGELNSGKGNEIYNKRKIAREFLAMALLAILASAYAIFSLHNLNELAYAIIDEDFIVVDTSKTMMDALLAQESARKDILFLKTRQSQSCSVAKP